MAWLDNEMQSLPEMAKANRRGGPQQHSRDLVPPVHVLFLQSPHDIELPSSGVHHHPALPKSYWCRPAEGVSNPPTQPNKKFKKCAATFCCTKVTCLITVIWSEE